MNVYGGDIMRRGHDSEKISHIEAILYSELSLNL